MTPFGHAALAYLAGQRAEKKNRWMFVLGGVLPDIDFLMLPFSFFNQVHRVATHNLFFLLAAALAAYGISKENKISRGLYLFAGGLLHLCVDAVMDDNATNGIGVAIFYPFSHWMFSPFNLTPPDATIKGWAHLDNMIQHLWDSMAIEIPFCILAVLLFSLSYVRKWKQEKQRTI